ncbi:MAG: hypothetical protein KGK07_14715 [Chloroflexota bacterium]|nr:hypothetical protein [Chloroflexota bacterium]
MAKTAKVISIKKHQSISDIIRESVQAYLVKEGLLVRCGDCGDFCRASAVATIGCACCSYAATRCTRCGGRKAAQRALMAHARYYVSHSGRSRDGRAHWHRFGDNVNMQRVAAE